MQVHAFLSKSATETLTPDQFTKDYLGGKGFGLFKMFEAGMSVPYGVVIPTKYSVEYNSLDENGKHELVQNAVKAVLPAMHVIEHLMSRKCLFSVRSGAPVSMPGMMDTILNVGISQQNLQEYEIVLGVKTARDSYRRLIQMLGTTAFGLEHEKFENELHRWKIKAGVEYDFQLEEKYLNEVIAGYEQIFENDTGQKFPTLLANQLYFAIKAVFESWNSERAVFYRKMEGIDDSMGTAVIIQNMVFGNMDDESGTGVLFTRNPATGDNELYGEFLQNAQGEDVVAGIRTPVPVAQMPGLGGPWKSIYDSLFELAANLEVSYKDMVDIEFTVENGKLWVLQSRNGKRTPRAALRIAHDLVDEGMISKSDIKKVLTAKQYLAAQTEEVDLTNSPEPTAKGIGACPGLAIGTPAFSSEQAVKMRAEGLKPILVVKETTPDDIEGMAASEGILTATGGTTSHAAVVARSMNLVCVCGVESMDLGAMMIDGTKIGLDSVVVLDGGSGSVWVDTEVQILSMAEDTSLKNVEDWLLEEESFVVEDGDPVIDNRIVSRAVLGDEKFVSALTLIGPKMKVFIDARMECEVLSEEAGPVYSKAMMLDLLASYDPLVEGGGLSTEKKLTLKSCKLLHGGKSVTKVLKGCGAGAIKEAKTFLDLINGDGSYMTNGTMLEIFGSKAVMDKVVETFNVKLMQTVTPLSRKAAVISKLEA